MLVATNTRFSGSKPSKSRRARDKRRAVGPMEQVRSIFEYIKGRDDKRWQKNERFVAHYPEFQPEAAKLISSGLSTNFKEMWEQLKQSGTDQVMYRYFDISPNTTLMDELQPDLWEAVTIATAAKGIRDYCQEKYGNHELNYLMSYQFAVDKDGRPHPHVHVVTEGSVFDNGRGERVPFAMYPEHLRRCKDCIDGSFAEQLDQTLGPELWQPIYAQWKERIAAEKEQAAHDKAMHELQELAQTLAGIDVPLEPSLSLSLEEVFASSPNVPVSLKAIHIPDLPAPSTPDVVPSVVPNSGVILIKRPSPTVTLVAPDQVIGRSAPSQEFTTSKIILGPQSTVEIPLPIQHRVPATKPPKEVPPPPPMRVQTPPPQRKERKLLKALPPLHLRLEISATYAAELSPTSGLINITKTYKEDGFEYKASKPTIRANDDAEAALYMKQLERFLAKEGFFGFMQGVEQAAVDNGFLDNNRADPRFFTEGPDDPWHTKRWYALHPPTQTQQPSPTPTQQASIEPEYNNPHDKDNEIEVDDGWDDIDL